MTEEKAVALTPMALVQQALTSGAGVDTLERLMALQERWQANEAKRDYDAAISALRADPDFKQIIKRRPAHSYKYEDLGDIAAMVDPILPKHGLAYRWKTWQDDKHNMLVTCIVSHSSGHREESSMQGNPDTSGSKNAIQAIGSAATYLQRYTLKQALGLAAARDDDAHAVSSQEATIDAVQYRELMHLIEKTGQDERSLLNYLQANDLNTLTLPQYRAAMDGLGKKLRRIEEREAVRREAELVKEVNTAEATVEWKDEEPVT